MLAESLALTLSNATPAATALPTQSTPAAASSTAPTTGTAASSASPPLTHTDSAKRLEVALTPYLWLTGLTGDVGIGRVRFSVDQNFGQIASESNGAFGLMGAVDIVYDRLVFQVNGAWTMVKGQRERGVFNTGTVTGNSKVESTWIEFLGGYRLVDERIKIDGEEGAGHRLTMDAFVGGRISILDTNATVTASAVVTLPDGRVLTPGASAKLDDSEEWIEPFIGVRGSIELGQGWSMIGRGDIGGFGVDHSQFSWQAIGAIMYSWDFDTWSMSLLAGYRALRQDYTNGGFQWDMIVHGPILGLQFRF